MRCASLSVVVLAALLLGACGATGESTKDLETLQGDGFSIKMPGTPKRSSRTIQSGAGPVTLTSYVSDGSEQAFSIAFTELPKAAKGDLVAALRGAATSLGGTLTDERMTKYQGFDTRDARILGVKNNKGTEGTLFTRVILTKDRLYELRFVVEGGDRTQPPDVYPQFRDSLKLA